MSDTSTATWSPNVSAIQAAPGDISVNIDDCFLFSPRMGDLDHGAT